jgi:hypothetical protein
MQKGRFFRGKADFFCGKTGEKRNKSEKWQRAMPVDPDFSRLS